MIAPTLLGVMAAAAIVAVALPLTRQGGDHLLAGPTIVEAFRAPSIISRDNSGRIEELAEPELVALRLLPLNDESRAAVESLHAQRRELFSRISREQLGELLKVQAGFATPPPSAGTVFRALRLLGAYKPYLDRGTLLDEAGPTLAGQAREARRMVGEYTLAVSRQRLADSGGVKTVQEVGYELRLAQLGAIIQEELQSEGEMGEEAATAFVAEFDLSPQQEKRLREIFGPVVEARLLGNRNVIAELGALGDAWDELTPLQRGRIVARSLLPPSSP